MPKFFIEVPHESDTLACAKVIKIFLSSGSHFLTNAEWGCLDGDHTARMLVDVEDKETARNIVPPAFREDAKVVGLSRFSMEEIDRIISRHSKPAPR